MHDHAPLLNSRGLLAVAVAMTCLVPAMVHAATYVRLETTLGSIVLELDEVKAPLTTANFLGYVDDGFYVDTTFHRVIDGFMIQGGGLLADKSKKTTKEPIPNEAGNGLTNNKYTIAMARTGNPHSATSQFFINVVDNKRLNVTFETEETRAKWGYCVFGHVVDGFDTVDKIRLMPVKGSVPNETIFITKAERVSDEDGAKLSAAAEEAQRQAAADVPERKRLAKEAAAEQKREALAATAAEAAKVVEQTKKDKMDALKTDSGLMYIDLEVGTGDEAVEGKSVSLHYTGWLTSNGNKFDSSLDRGQPLPAFILGTGSVIKGWDEGVVGMKVGGKRKLIIPPDLAYGSRGSGAAIPPNAELVFEVELLQVN